MVEVGKNGRFLSNSSQTMSAPDEPGQSPRIQDSSHIEIGSVVKRPGLGKILLLASHCLDIGWVPAVGKISHRARYPPRQPQDANLESSPALYNIV